MHEIVNKHASLYLASTSPRRRQLLAQLGYVFTPLDVSVPEIPTATETAAAYVARVAMDKACAGLSQCAADANAYVIAGDTEVVVDGRIMGKPESREHARTILQQLSGRVHQVVSSVCVVSANDRATRQCVSHVRIMPLTSALIEAYLNSGEYEGKAGAYAIQGRGAAFVAHLEGSYSAVMGLPLFETAALLRAVGLNPRMPGKLLIK